MMINFDLDTNKYEALTHKAAPTAYYKIRRYMEKNDFYIDKVLAMLLIKLQAEWK